MTCDCEDSPRAWAKKKPRTLFLWFLAGMIVATMMLWLVGKFLTTVPDTLLLLFRLIPVEQQVLALYLTFGFFFWKVLDFLAYNFMNGIEIASTAFQARRIQLREWRSNSLPNHHRTLLDLKRAEERQ